MYPPKQPQGDYLVVFSLGDASQMLSVRARGRRAHRRDFRAFTGPRAQAVAGPLLFGASIGLQAQVRQLMATPAGQTLVRDRFAALRRRTVGRVAVAQLQVLQAAGAGYDASRPAFAVVTLEGADGAAPAAATAGAAPGALR